MMRNALMILGTILASVVASVAVTRFWQPRPTPTASPTLHVPPRDATSPSTAPASTADVVALGTLQPTGGVIQVGGMAGERIASILVHEGQDVRAGDVLAIFESYRLREAERDAARATVAEARAQIPLETDVGNADVAQARLGVREVELRRTDLKSQEEATAQARANLEGAKRDLARLQGLDETIVSTQQRERQELVVGQAATAAVAAENTLAKAKQTIEFEKELATVRLQAAEAGQKRRLAALQVDSLERSVKLSEARLEMSQVRAPLNGRIFKVVMLPGETTGQVPILRMGQIEEMFVVAEVYETDAGRVRPGQQATIIGDAIISASTGQRYEMAGEVVTVGAIISNNEVRSVDPTDRGDLRVVETRVRIAPKFREAAARLVNLQVTVRIHTGETPATSAVSQIAEPGPETAAR